METIVATPQKNYFAVSYFSQEVVGFSFPALRHLIPVYTLKKKKKMRSSYHEAETTAI